MTAVANLEMLTVGALVQALPHGGAWLRACGIDPQARESLHLADACAASDVNMREVVTGLSVLGSEHVADADVDLDRLCRFIVLYHHANVREALPRLEAAVSRLSRADGAIATTIARLFAPVPYELTAHLAKEENILFPAIVVLAEARRGGRRPAPGAFATIYHPIRVMEAEHARVEDALAELRLLSRDFTPVEGASEALTACLRALQVFCRDLQQHTRLENELLFPRALDLERALH